MAYTIDEDGTLIPDRSDGVSDPPPVPERTMLNIIEYRYEYDQYGNWTERTVVFRQESYEPIHCVSPHSYVLLMCRIEAKEKASHRSVTVEPDA